MVAVSRVRPSFSPRGTSSDTNRIALSTGTFPMPSSLAPTAA
jgi:hypothetical protein